MLTYFSNASQFILFNLMSGLTPGLLVSLLSLSLNSVHFFGNFAAALPIRPTTARPNIIQDTKAMWAV